MDNNRSLFSLVVDNIFDTFHNLEQRKNKVSLKDYIIIYPLNIMTATEKLHQLIQTLPENQINEVLHFVEFLQQKQLKSSQAIPPVTLTGLRGIAAGRANTIQRMRGLLKTDQPALTDQDVAAMLEERRMEKYL